MLAFESMKKIFCKEHDRIGKSDLFVCVYFFSTGSARNLKHSGCHQTARVSVEVSCSRLPQKFSRISEEV